MQPKFIIVDTETTGLSPDENVMIELGIQIYTARLDLIDEFSSVISDSITVDHLAWLELQEDKYVWDMHQKNGLYEQIMLSSRAIDHQWVERDAIEFLQKNGIGENRIMLPMCGSSILFDRSFIQKQMPELNKQFHYRNEDVSSMREFCKVWRPELVTQYSDQIKDKTTAHRVLADCAATRDELAFYAENLFIE